MRSDPEIPGKHRSERVLIIIPVQISCYFREEKHAKERGRTLVVAQDRALLRLPSRLPLGTLLEVTNCYSDEMEKFRVAHVDGEAKEGQFHVIVDMLKPRDGFWKIGFPSRVRVSHSRLTPARHDRLDQTMPPANR